MPVPKSRVAELQGPLRARYRTSPETARITDRARTLGGRQGDPFHTDVEPAPGLGVAVPVGVHGAVGGLHDAATPGDILCAALAACLDSTIRMVADILGAGIEALEVEVTAEVDVRGTLAVERDVPVGFQSMRCAVHLKARQGTSPEILDRLLKTAERSCIVLQTLRAGVPVETSVDLDGDRPAVEADPDRGSRAEEP